MTWTFGALKLYDFPFSVEQVELIANLKDRVWNKTVYQAWYIKGSDRKCES